MCTRWVEEALGARFRYDQVERLERAQLGDGDRLQLCLSGTTGEGRRGQFWITLPLATLDAVERDPHSAAPSIHPSRRAWYLPRTAISLEACARPASPGRGLAVLRRRDLPVPGPGFDDAVRTSITRETLDEGMYELIPAGAYRGKVPAGGLVYFDRTRSIAGDHFLGLKLRPARQPAHPLLPLAAALARAADWLSWPLHLLALSRMSM